MNKKRKRSYNPIVFLAIRPALRLVDAHNHPIRGGAAAAIASLIAHYALLLVVGWFFGYDVEGVLVTVPIVGHALMFVNALVNLLIGIERYRTRKCNNKKAR